MAGTRRYSARVETTRTGRLWHTVTLVVAALGLVLQIVAIVTRTDLLDHSAVTASMPEQVRRYFCYFTIQSNLLVAVSMALILRGRTDTRLFRVVRLASLIGITVTGVVAFVALAPSSNYTALNLLCDRLLHIAVPLLTVVGWAVFGPRGKIHRDDLLPALAWPVLWLVATLALGPVVDWYPYPFLRVNEIGWGQTLLNCLVIAVLFFALAGLARWVDRRLTRRRPASVTR